MKVKYIVQEYGLLESRLSGVAKKINGQVAALKAHGIDCEIGDLSRSEYGKVTSRLPFGSDGYAWTSMGTESCDAVYIRKPWYISKEFINWLAQAKGENPRLRVLLEFPTFPYDAEYSKLHQKPLLLKDQMHRGELKKYVDRAVDLSGSSEIFGIPTLRVVNGIDLSGERPRKPRPSQDGALRLVCVAAFSRWHGIDRLIEGLAVYRDGGGTRRTELHLVGDGPALGEYRGQVERLGLGDAVVFHGQMQQGEFAYLYDECDLAIECLGDHRKGVTISSSLKSREYLAKGIPFAYSGEIDVFLDEPVDFCLQLPADESPVDVGELVGFCDRLYARESPDELTERIRDYAERHVSMGAAIKPVIDYLKEECEQ